MSQKPSPVGEMMMLHGAAVLFGPDYLKNSLQLLRELKGSSAGMAVLGAETIDELGLPNGPVLACSLIFFHRKPEGVDWGRWDTLLLENIELSSAPPKGLGVADRSPEAPTVELAPAGSGGEMQLILLWKRPLEASHIVRTARAIERAYVENGGQYDKPGVLRRLRRFFS